MSIGGFNLMAILVTFLIPRLIFAVPADIIPLSSNSGKIF